MFLDRLDGINLEKVNQWYNGYNWLGESVFCPFDVLLFLDKRVFKAYWFETGTPTFILKLIEQGKYHVPQIETITATERILESFDVEKIELETLLFQTGYLTIAEQVKKGNRTIYYLKYPNYEVKIGLTDYLLDYFTGNLRNKEKNIQSLYELVENNQLHQLKDLFYQFFASIPNDWYRKNHLAGYEGYYASKVYCYFSASGLNVLTEDTTNHGRIDLTVLYKDRCYIFEFKVVSLDPEGTTLAQIKGKRYYEKYQGKFADIFLIGVAFNKEERSITKFEVEKVF